MTRQPWQPLPSDEPHHQVPKIAYQEWYIVGDNTRDQIIQHICHPHKAAFGVGNRYPETFTVLADGGHRYIRQNLADGSRPVVAWVYVFPSDERRNAWQAARASFVAERTAANV